MIPLFHRLRLSPVLGFMLVGVAVGPFGLAMLADRLPLLGAITLNRPEAIGPIAELGISMLMFMIGLELSLERLRVMHRLVFGFGLSQFVLCAVAIGAIAYAIGAPPALAAVAGFALSMSSTAVVVQVLSQEKRLGGPVGRASLGVLLLQDIAAVPVLFVIGVFGMSGNMLTWTIAEATLVILGLIVAGRLVLRPLFRSVVRTGSPELFVAACLLVILATSLAAAEVDLPMELGSLIAGLLLAETEFRRQIEVTIDPFKGLLLGVFLISVGMSLDLADIAADAPRVVLAGVVIITVKAVIIACLARAFGLRWLTGAQAGLLLGPGGEFGFVILALARAGGIVGADVVRFPLVVAVATMACIPLMSTLGRLMSRGAPIAPAIDPALLVPLLDDATPRVIIAGFGRVGETVASMLEVHSVSVCRGGQRRRPCRRAAQVAALGLLGRHHADRATASAARGDGTCIGGDDGRSRGERPAGGGGACRSGRPADRRAGPRCAARGASLCDRRHRCGAGNHRGQPATVRGGAGRSRRADGSGDRHHPRTSCRTTGGDQGDGAARRGATVGQAAAARHAAAGGVGARNP